MDTLTLIIKQKYFDEIIIEPMPGSDLYGWIFTEHMYHLGVIIDRK